MAYKDKANRDAWNRRWYQQNKQKAALRRDLWRAENTWYKQYASDWVMWSRHKAWYEEVKAGIRHGISTNTLTALERDRFWRIVRFRIKREARRSYRYPNGSPNWIEFLN